MTKLRFLVFHGDGGDLGKVTDQLDDMGYDVVHAGDVDNGLEIADGCDEYVGLIDLSVLGAGGIDDLKRISQAGTLYRLVVLTDPSIKERMLKEVANDVCLFLTKPVDPDDLRQLIESVSELYSLRQEVTVKARRVSHLEVINEIARETLINNDENTLLWKIAQMINSKLSFYNVDIFLVDDTRENVVLKAFAGGYGEDLAVGFTLKMGDGITGWVARNRESLLVGDVSNDPRRIIGFSFEENIHSELGVPIMVGDSVLGVIHVESEEIDAFTHNDVIVLETIADQIALALENMRLSGELLDAFQLSATVNDSLPVSIILVDRDLRIQYANRTFCDIANVIKEDILNQPVTNFFSFDIIEKLGFSDVLEDVFASGVPICHTNVHHTSPHHHDKILNITLARVQTGKHPQVMILIQDVTDFTIKTRQLSLLREISIAMQGVFERDILLHMILTSVTAGFAMGFNRAFLFLVNNENDRLDGTMGVGPKSRDEAYRIWNDLSNRSFTFEDYLADIGSGKIIRSGLQDIVQSISCDLNGSNNILTETVRTRNYFHVLDAWENPAVDKTMKKIVASHEFVTIPLIARDEVIGVLFADNAYSGQPISDESIEELGMFAASAALAVENSHMLKVLENQVKELEKAYKELEKTHEMLIRHEKLAAIGEVSTRLAHEIRNPLATIGGFAQSIPRKYKDRERTIRNANIILDEVERLENILTNVLDFSKTGAPQKTRNDINNLLKETVKIMEGAATEHNIVVVLELSGEDTAADFDASQIKQVIINLIQNAFNAMSEGGALRITTTKTDQWIQIVLQDTGCGIPEEYLDNVFDPFFTTRHDGTGLGLSISQRIVQNHNGSLDIQSEEDEGTTITIRLPA